MFLGPNPAFPVRELGTPVCLSHCMTNAAKCMSLARAPRCTPLGTRTKAQQRHNRLLDLSLILYALLSLLVWTRCPALNKRLPACLLLFGKLDTNNTVFHLEPAT